MRALGVASRCSLNPKAPPSSRSSAARFVVSGIADSVRNRTRFQLHDCSARTPPRFRSTRRLSPVRRGLERAHRRVRKQWQDGQKDRRERIAAAAVPDSTLRRLRDWEVCSLEDHAVHPEKGRSHAPPAPSARWGFVFVVRRRTARHDAREERHATPLHGASAVVVTPAASQLFSKPSGAPAARTCLAPEARRSHDEV